MKDPKKCGNSIEVCGIHICRLENTPCLRVDGCAEDHVQEFVKAMAEAIERGEKVEG